MAECARCGSALAVDSGYCKDATCPFSSRAQSEVGGWVGHPTPPAAEAVDQAGKRRDDLGAMTALARDLRGELLYVHTTYDVRDSVSNSATLLEEAEELLGPPDD